MYCIASRMCEQRSQFQKLLFLIGSFLLYSPSVSAEEDDKPPEKLVVATREVPPFAWKNKDGEWIGLSIELLREIKADLQKDSTNKVELEFREMSLEKMLLAVEKKEVDLVAAALTVNYEREKKMDFSHPFHNSGLGIAISQKLQKSNWEGILSALFSSTMLKIVGGLFAILLLSGIAIYYCERKKNAEQFGGGTGRGIAAGIWWAAVTMTTVGYGDKAPKSFAGRTLAFFWMLGGLFIIAGFTAAVTSALTLRQLKSRIAGPADLSRVKVATVEDSTSEQFLRSRHIKSMRRENVRQALELLKTGRVDAVVYDAPLLRHEILQHFNEEFRVLSVTFEPQEYAFALPSGSKLRERINQVILRKVRSPEWRDLLAEYLGR